MKQSSTIMFSLRVCEWDTETGQFDREVYSHWQNGQHRDSNQGFTNACNVMYLCVVSQQSFLKPNEVHLYPHEVDFSYTYIVESIILCKNVTNQ